MMLPSTLGRILARRSVRAGTLLCVTALAFVAGGRLRHRAPRGTGPGLNLAAGEVVSYSLAWSWDGATWDEARHSYVFKTDRGYVIRLEAGYLGTVSLELVPCHPTAPASASGALLDLLAPAAAYANHGYIHDSTLVQAPVVETIVSKEVRPFGAGQGSPKSYCQLHELLAPLDQLSPDGFHLDHWSAFVRGGYVLPSGGEEKPFESHINLRGGALVDLHQVGATAAGNQTSVTVTRSPLHVFDGVALEKLTSSEIAYAFMRGLTKGTRAEYSR